MTFDDLFIENWSGLVGVLHAKQQWMMVAKAAAAAAAAAVVPSHSVMALFMWRHIWREEVGPPAKFQGPNRNCVELIESNSPEDG